MHVLVILLIGTVLLADQGVFFNVVPNDNWMWLAPTVAFVPPLVCLAIEMVLIRRAIQAAADGQRVLLKAASRRLRMIQWLSVVCSVVAILGMGWLELIRAQIGNVIWFDELLAIVPALILICLSWIVQWPLERLVREALIIRRLDEGMPIHPVPSRSTYLLVQIRSQLLIVLMPAVVVLLGVEMAEAVVQGTFAEETALWLGPIATGCVAIVCILLAPLGVVLAVGARPLPAGPLRDSMEAIIEDAGVRVRNVMLWPTGHSMLNGAVIGFIPRLRYVLLTDGLIETLSHGELRAVMAHEVGHLKFRHLPWTLAVLLGLIGLVAQLFDWAVPFVYDLLVNMGFTSETAASSIQSVGTVAVFVIAFVVYGWVSRRFERQADSSAACQLSHSEPDSDSRTPSESVTPQGAGLMCGALESVAVLNGLDPGRNTWRHGSIRWRQQYLLRLIGQPVRGLKIDAQIRVIKLVSALALAILVGLAVFDTALMETIFGSEG